MPVRALRLSLLKLSKSGAALGAEVERDRNCDVSFERRPFPLRPCLPLVSLFERSPSLPTHVDR
jgi:hypothetical protein